MGTFEELGGGHSGAEQPGKKRARSQRSGEVWAGLKPSRRMG